jgi:hypothetical protein
VWRLAHPDAPAAPPVARFDVALPAGTAFDAASASVAISADGSHVAFVACASESCRIFARRLDETEARPVPGTDGAASPFLSPDGSALGFFADGKLKRIDLAGGMATALADVRQPLGATWTDEGWIVFAASRSGGLGGLMRVTSIRGAANSRWHGPMFFRADEPSSPLQLALPTCRRWPASSRSPRQPASGRRSSIGRSPADSLRQTPSCSCATAV